MKRNSLRLQIYRFFSDEEGAMAVEYGLLAGLIGLAIILAANNLAQVIVQAFNVISAALQAGIGIGAGGGSGSGS